MAIVTIQTIKNWFKTGLKPTQAQFWAVFDSYRHKSEKVPFNDVDGLTDLFNEKADAEALNNHINSADAHADLLAGFLSDSDLPTITLSTFNDDIGATDALVPFTAFVDNVNGDDVTAVFFNPSKPFKTIDGVFSRYLPKEYPNEFLKIHLLSGGNYPINGSNLPLINYEIYSDFSSVVDFSNNENNYLYFTNNGNGLYVTSFNIRNGTIKSDRQGGAGISIFSEDCLFYMEVKNLYLNQSNAFIQAGQGVRIPFIKKATVSGTISQNGFQIGDTVIEELNILGTSAVSSIFRSFDYVKIKKVTGSGGINMNGAPNTFEIGDYLCDQPLRFVYHTGNNKIIWNDSQITNGFYFTQSLGRVTMTGSIKLLGPITGNWMYSGYFSLENLVINSMIDKFKLGSYGSTTFNVKNSFINCPKQFILCRPSNTAKLTDINIEGSVIKQTLEPSSLIESGGSNVSLNLGGAETNAISLVDNSDILVEYTLLSFKDRSNEIVVRSKTDIINRPLNLETTYIIDGDIELLAGEYIEPPAGGNLTLNGYGLEASKIIKNVAGESIVKSPIGGSGGLQMDSLKMVMGTPTTTCFDLTDSTGFNAVECVKVNFEGSGSIGILNGYRQGLWDNIGLFGIMDGVKLEGTWIGGFVTYKVIARNLTGTTGSVFSKGAALSLASRFFTDGNIDVPTGWNIADFEDSNFVNENTFQVQGAIITRNGVFDKADVNYFPNINEESRASDWVKNEGIGNSSVAFQKMKSPDGTVYKLEVDNSGNLTATAI